MRLIVFFFQAEDGIRDLVRSRGLGDVYKRQLLIFPFSHILFNTNRISPEKKVAKTASTPLIGYILSLIHI